MQEMERYSTLPYKIKLFKINNINVHFNKILGRENL